MKKVNVTFSIPEDTRELLYSLVGQRKMSSFVAQAINKALSEKMDILKRAYKEAEKDPDRLAVIEDWKALDTEDWE